MHYLRCTDSLRDRSDYYIFHWDSLHFLHAIHYSTTQDYRRFVATNICDDDNKHYLYSQNYIFKSRLQTCGE